MNYRFQLDKSSKKFLCKGCGKKRLVRFIDSNTGEYTDEEYGRCDREVSCGYHKKPSSQGKHFTSKPSNIVKPPKKAFLPKKVLTGLRSNGYADNQFINNLRRIVPIEISDAMIYNVFDLYGLGTYPSYPMKGALAIPFIDEKDRLHAIQVKSFNKENHTVKTNFIHSLLKYQYKRLNKRIPVYLNDYFQSDSKVDCFFGEFLLKKFPNHPVAVVESPKTAILCALYFGLPFSGANNYLWIAAYNLSSLNAKRLKVLEGRKVILFPDGSENGTAFKKWFNKAKNAVDKTEYSSMVIDSWLEENLTKEEKEKGVDLADKISAIWTF